MDGARDPVGTAVVLAAITMHDLEMVALVLLIVALALYVLGRR
jgi:uncharacterized membrane protein YqhA